MSTLVRRGQVMTPRRQRLVAAYLERHEWLYKWRPFGDVRYSITTDTPWGRWPTKARVELAAWERAFLYERSEQTKVGTGKTSHPEDDC